MSEPTAEIVTFGETMVSLRGEGLCRYPAAFSASPAGSETNVAIALARLGHQVSWISRLGVDMWGDGIIATLRAEGVTTSGVERDPYRPTGLMALLRRPGGLAEVDYRRAGSAASALTGEHIIDAMGQPKHVHLTGITPALSTNTRRACFTAVEAAHDRGATVSFDINFRSLLWDRTEAAPVLHDLANHCDIVIGSPHELTLIDEDPTRLLDGNTQIIVRKLGAAGAEAWNADGHTKHDGFTVPVIDTVGAGDGFSAGLISGLIDGLSLTGALERGNIVGACAVGAQGDWQAYPERRDLARFANTEETLR